MNKKLHGAGALMTALLVSGLGLTGCTGLDSTAAKDHPYSANGNGKQSKDHGKQKQHKAKAPSLSKPQEEAIGTAQDYLSTQAFSKKGLIGQMKFEGYKVPLATWAVNHIKVDWNQEAYKSGKEYLSTQHFSRAGLIHQLEFEGFTPAQAVYGANKVGL